MSQRRATALAGVGLAVLLASAATFAAFVVWGGFTTGSRVLVETSWWLAWVPLGLAGAVVAVRRPALAIGWLMLAASLATLASAAAGQYGSAAVVGDPWRPPRVPLVEWLAVSLDQGIQLLALVIAHFPEGPGNTRWWRRALRLGWVGFGVGAVVTAFTPDGTSQGVGEVAYFDNPFAWPWLRWLEAAEGPAFAIVGLVGVGAIVRLAWRFRSAPPIERRQVELFLYVVVMSTVIWVGGNTLERQWGLAVGDLIADFGFPIIVSGMAVALALAVTRYRLYDIDRVISRTVTYTIVIALLVGVYAAGVLGVGALLPGERSDLLVAASTLSVAALFRPVTSRVRDLVDRRFNRARYDAARTVEAFGARLRDQLDPGAIGGELRNAVNGALEPAQTSISVIAAPEALRRRNAAVTVAEDAVDV